MLVIRRVILLGQCTVPSVQISQKKPKMIENTILLRNPEPPKHDVTFKYKLDYEDFPGFYALRQQKKQPTWPSYQNSKCWTWRYHHRSGWNESQRRLAFMSTFPRNFSTRTQSIQLCKRGWMTSPSTYSVQPKWNWLLNSFWRLEMIGILDIFTLLTKKPSWTDQNLCTTKTTWHWRHRVV